MDEIIKRPESAEDARREAEIRDNFAGEPTLWPVPTLLRFLDSERAKSEGLRKALAEVDRLSLVIESAVRNADPKNHAAVLAAIKATRAALSASPSPTPKVSVGDPSGPGSQASPGAPDGSPPSVSIPIARTWRSLPRDGDFSTDADALNLLRHDIDCFPEGAPVKISLAPRVLYISWPNDAYRPDDGSDPYHCVNIWLAEGNVAAREIEKRRLQKDIDATLDAAWNAAQGIVTGGQDPQGLGEREARVEPGPATQDAPVKDGDIPPTTVKGETL